ncbi:MAG: glycosyltransferase family 2 protein [Burkholderiales bacterium]|nr:glycosyltransferase family 2 protein [Burkholderiales bacterium]
MRRTCGIIIPVYNEDRAIADTVKRIQAICAQIADYDFEIICINDGSSDRSGEILAALAGITVLTHEVNRGYGAALRTGLDYCTREWVFITDADGTYPLEDLVHLLEAAESGFDMVVGSREGAGISRSPFRRLARWILRKMVHGLTGVMVPDLNSGMRVFRKTLYVEFRHLLPLGFSFTTTLTVASLYSGRRVRYVPVDYQRRIGKSNIKPVKDFLGFVILIVRLASYFDPLKFFLPAAMGLFGLGVLRAVRDVIVVNQFGALSVILLITAFQIFAFGVIADVIVRRFQVIPSNPQLSNPNSLAGLQQVVREESQKH